MQTSLALSTTLFLLISTTTTTISATRTTTPPGAVDFIHSSCDSASFPALCIRSLSPFASLIHPNPRQLARAALSVSALLVQEACTYITPKSGRPGGTPLNGPALQDCVATMTDSVSRLRQSVAQLGRMGPKVRAGSPRFVVTVSNVQTWVSAALTDQNTCLSSLSQAAAAGNYSTAEIRVRVLEVSQVTSNALSLVNLIH